MNGVLEEYELFQATQKNAIILPVGSTGAAAKIIYESMGKKVEANKRLLTDYAYMTLFRDLLKEDL